MLRLPAYHRDAELGAGVGTQAACTPTRRLTGPALPWILRQVSCRDGCENSVIEHMTGFFPTGRDRGVTVAVEGFFAFVWFGWGQAAAPSWLVVPLAVGAGLAVLLAVAGVVVTARSTGRLRVMADPGARRRYGIIVGLEFGLLGAGAAILGATGQYRWTPVLICAGVGAHFFPLASALDNRSLRLLGGLLVAVAAGRWPGHAQVHLGAPGQASQPHLAVAPHG